VIWAKSRLDLILALKITYSMKKPNFWGLEFTLAALIFMVVACKGGDDTTIYGNWKRIADFEGIPRHNSISFVINNKAYVGLGYNIEDDEYLNDVWEYDPVRKFWVQRANFPGKGRTSAAAFSIDSKGYVGTGYDGDDELKDFWEYNASANTWTRKTDFGGEARRGAVGFAITNQGYIGTGSNTNDFQDFWLYKPTIDTWEQVASIGSKRINAFAMVINNKAYVGGGRNNGAAQRDFWEYDSISNAWTRKNNLDDDDNGDAAIPRESAVTFTLNNLGYLITGASGSILNTCWEYSPDSDSWTEKTGLEGTPRRDAVGFALNGKGYVTTGSNGSGQFDDFWEFDPVAEQDDDDN
jgi:N-acetylneuraminic acid mutarotase